MAKFKSTATGSRKPAGKRDTATSPRARKSAASSAAADAGGRTIMDSAQQIWQTGVKALGRAQQESTRLFEALVKEGAGVEKKTRSLATGKVDSVRDAVENRVGQVKDRATDTWDRLEKVFEERVQRALTRLGVPGRDELQALIDRVDELNARLRDLHKAAPAAAAAATRAPSKAASKKTAEAVKAAPKPPKVAAPAKSRKSARPTTSKPAPAPRKAATKPATKAAASTKAKARVTAAEAVTAPAPAPTPIPQD